MKLNESIDFVKGLMFTERKRFFEILQTKATEKLDLKRSSVIAWPDVLLFLQEKDFKEARKELIEEIDKKMEATRRASHRAREERGQVDKFSFLEAGTDSKFVKLAPFDSQGRATVIHAFPQERIGQYLDRIAQLERIVSRYRGEHGTRKAGKQVCSCEHCREEYKDVCECPICKESRDPSGVEIPNPHKEKLVRLRALLRQVIDSGMIEGGPTNRRKNLSMSLKREAESVD